MGRLHASYEDGEGRPGPSSLLKEDAEVRREAEDHKSHGKLHIFRVGFKETGRPGLAWLVVRTADCSDCTEATLGTGLTIFSI